MSPRLSALVAVSAVTIVTSALLAYRLVGWVGLAAVVAAVAASTYGVLKVSWVQDSAVDAAVKLSDAADSFLFFVEVPLGDPFGMALESFAVGRRRLCVRPARLPAGAAPLADPVRTARAVSFFYRRGPVGTIDELLFYADKAGVVNPPSPAVVCFTLSECVSTAPTAFLDVATVWVDLMEEKFRIVRWDTAARQGDSHGGGPPDNCEVSAWEDVVLGDVSAETLLGSW